MTEPRANSVYRKLMEYLLPPEEPEEEECPEEEPEEEEDGKEKIFPVVIDHYEPVPYIDDLSKRTRYLKATVLVDYSPTEAEVCAVFPGKNVLRPLYVGEDGLLHLQVEAIGNPFYWDYLGHELLRETLEGTLWESSTNYNVNIKGEYGCICSHILIEEA